jgi:HD-like signal output (HDOD) protein
MLADITPEVLEKLSRCKDLPSPPGVAAQIIELTQTVNSDVQTLAEVVSMDPVLSAKIIRMANSSLYMRRVEAVNVQQAVTMFGWTGTLNIALSFSLVNSAKKSNTTGLDYDLFWKRSLATAVACRKLGEITGYPLREELFLPGLLQDIGMLAIDKAIPGVYVDLKDIQQNHKKICQLEKSKIQSDHADIGAWLLSSWRIPEKITRLIAISHNIDAEEHAGLDAKLVKCILHSGMMADCIYCDEEYKDYMKAADVADKEFNLDITDFLSLIGKLTEEYQELAALFDVDAGDNHSLQENAENAKKVLLQSMGVVG